MSGQDFNDLVADIKANGQHNPIITLDGEILDGRNRWEASKAAGIEDGDIWTVEFVRTHDPLDFVISQNYRRRHLTQSQAAMVAAEIAKLQQGRKAAGDATPSVKEAADAMRVSASSVQAAKRVRKKDAKLADAVKAGTVTLHAAEQQLKAQETLVQPSPEVVELMEAAKVFMEGFAECGAMQQPRDALLAEAAVATGHLAPASVEMVQMSDTQRQIAETLLTLPQIADAVKGAIAACNIPPITAADNAFREIWPEAVPSQAGVPITTSGIRTMSTEEIVAWLMTPDGKEWFDAEWKNVHPSPPEPQFNITEVTEHPPMEDYRLVMRPQQSLTAEAVEDWMLTTNEGSAWRAESRHKFLCDFTATEANEWIATTMAGEQWLDEYKVGMFKEFSAKQPQQRITPALVTAWIVTPEGQSWLKDYNTRHGGSSLKKPGKHEDDIAAGRTVRIPTGPPFSLAHMQSALVTLTAMIPSDAEHAKFADVLSTFAAKELQLVRKQSDRFSPYTS